MTDNRHEEPYNSSQHSPSENTSAEITAVELYRLCRLVLGNTQTMKPTKRTILQLKNVGGMRLIKNKVSNDLIIAYDGNGKDVVEQKDIFKELFNENLYFSYQLFDMNFYMQDATGEIPPNAKLLTHDKDKLIQFANRVTILAGGINALCYLLDDMNSKAINLIEGLRKEYNLKH